MIEHFPKWLKLVSLLDCSGEKTTYAFLDRVLVVILALGSRPRQRGCKVAGQEEAQEPRQRGPKGADQVEAQESHHILPGM